MTVYVYKVISAPTQGKRGKGVKGAEARFANSLEGAINELAADGWEYLRAESLPSVERVGVLRKQVETYQNMLVFRRSADVVSAPEQDDKPRTSFFRRSKKAAADPTAQRTEPTVSETVAEAAPEPAQPEQIAEVDMDQLAEEVLESATEFAAENRNG